MWIKNYLEKRKAKKEWHAQVYAWCKRYLTVDLFESVHDCCNSRQAAKLDCQLEELFAEYYDYHYKFEGSLMTDPAEEAGTILLTFLPWAFQKKLNDSWYDFYGPVYKKFVQRCGPVQNKRMIEEKNQ